MEIKTKFNIGDKVIVLSNYDRILIAPTPGESTIVSIITVTNADTPISITYRMKEKEWCDSIKSTVGISRVEEDVWATWGDLMKYIENKQIECSNT